MEPNTPPTPDNLEPTNQPTPQPVQASPIIASIPPVAVNKIWAKSIPLINYIFLGVCLGFLLLVDFPILIQSPELKDFWDMMLIAVGALVVFTILELVASRVLRSITPSNGTDMTVMILIAVRNFIIFLNVIPYIQLLGLVAAFFAAPVIVLIEVIMVVMRLVKRPKS